MERVKLRRYHHMGYLHLNRIEAASYHIVSFSHFYALPDIEDFLSSNLWCC